MRAWAEQIGELIAAAIEASPFSHARIRRVGLGLPALVDSIGGVVHWLQTYPLESVDVGAIVERRVGLPVSVDNGFNIMARAEHWFGEDRQVDDFSLVAVGLALGLAEYVDGTLKTGAHGINSEFAHTKVALDDEVVCRCGARGCLATYAAFHGVVLRTFAARGQPPPRTRDIEAAYVQCGLDARAGEATASAAFQLAGRTLGLAVSNLINMSDPARVLVLALDPGYAELIAGAFYASLHENTLPALRGRTPVQLKVSEEARYSHGAAALVLEQLYRSAAAPQQEAVPA
jgi:predicted NBD/HSP70 family sugar kinase